METMTKQEAHKKGLLAPYIETFTGKRFYFLNPQPDNIDIQDIAHALSMNCRWTGHCKQFYSVAEHSVACSYLAQNPLEGLLHDASEAYLTDVASPVKQYLPDYHEIENIIMTAIAKKFGVSWPVSLDTKDADAVQLKTEARALLTSKGADWVDAYPTKRTDGIKPTCWQPHQAELAFLSRYHELVGV